MLNQPVTTNIDNNRLRIASISDQPEILTDIYREETNIVVWQRNLPSDFQSELHRFLESSSSFQIATAVTPQSVLSALIESLGEDRFTEMLSESVSEMVDMFCCLFELKQAGLRLKKLDHAMCPRFHVDKVPCRLVTTYCGPATEWLPHGVVDRSKLGAGSEGIVDEQSGLFADIGDIQQLATGDVALLKGENWEGNENAGLVHRSPGLADNKKRLLLTLDCLN